MLPVRVQSCFMTPSICANAAGCCWLLRKPNTIIRPPTITPMIAMIPQAYSMLDSRLIQTARGLSADQCSHNSLELCQINWRGAAAICRQEPSRQPPGRCAEHDAAGLVANRPCATIRGGSMIGAFGGGH